MSWAFVLQFNISHGIGGSRRGYSYLASHLAGEGFAS
jgi:predicted dienelactone hydrolase